MWGPGYFPNNRTDVCGFLKPPKSDKSWKVRKHGAFSIPRQALGLAFQAIKAAIMRHGYTWIFVDWRNHDEPDQRIRLKERPTPYQYGQRKRERMSESSFFAFLNDHAYLGRVSSLT